MSPPENHRYYQLVERAIKLIEQQAALGHTGSHSPEASLEKLARELSVSPFHLQRIFSAWAGVSPKQFFLCLQQSHARRLLANGENLINTSEEVGLQSASKLHHLMLKFESMTPGDIKNQGASLVLDIGQADSPFGPAFVAHTAKGLNSLEFQTERLDYETWRAAMVQLYPKATFQENHSQAKQTIEQVFLPGSNSPAELILHLKGTPFQLQVWQALLHIPLGQLLSYQQVARILGQPNASRAVGSAIARNSIAYLIPCHRVIQATGTLGQYRWHHSRKKALHVWEQGQINSV